MLLYMQRQVSSYDTIRFCYFYLSDYASMSRRLLRFSSTVYNQGTADFRPVQHRSTWEWHQCHKYVLYVTCGLTLQLLNSDSIRLPKFCKMHHKLILQNIQGKLRLELPGNPVHTLPYESWERMRNCIGRRAGRLWCESIIYNNGGDKYCNHFMIPRA